MATRRDFTGQVFGRLTVLEYCDSVHWMSRWTCRCECGAVTTVRSDHLIQQRVRSCGCLKREMTSARATTHGESRPGQHTREYRVWAHMFRRCYDPNTKRFERYGGRGITVCERWRDYATFRADMGPCPDGHTIERIDNDGHYEPSNARWATHAEQMRNTSRTRLLTHHGLTLCMKDWAARLGFSSYGIIASRLRRGWSVDQALTTPVRTIRRAATSLQAKPSENT
jgi:hypothetical protein